MIRRRSLPDFDRNLPRCQDESKSNSQAPKFNCGGNEVIPKPVDFVELTLAISRLLLHRVRLQTSVGDKSPGDLAET